MGKPPRRRLHLPRSRSRRRGSPRRRLRGLLPIFGDASRLRSARPRAPRPCADAPPMRERMRPCGSTTCCVQAVPTHWPFARPARHAGRPARQTAQVRGPEPATLGRPATPGPRPGAVYPASQVGAGNHHREGASLAVPTGCTTRLPADIEARQPMSCFLGLLRDCGLQQRVRRRQANAANPASNRQTGAGSGTALTCTRSSNAPRLSPPALEKLN